MLTVDDLREHVTSSLGDDALEMLLGAAYEVIDDRVGSDADVTEVITAGPGPLLMLSRKASAIVSITEGTTDLDPTDFSVSGRTLWRLLDGANPQSWWRGRIQVTYTPAVNADRRDAAAVALVSLSLDTLDTGAAQSERIGDWSETFSSTSEVRQKRDDILAELSSTGLVLI